MKKYLLLLLVLSCLLSLAGCGCRHAWTDANCLEAKRCSACGITEGQPLGHDYGDAAINCESPRACVRCQAPEADAKAHTWQDATTDAPKTCSVCGTTEGDRIITDPRFTTDACKDLFGHWEGEYIMTGEMMGDATLPDMPVILGITFRNDGTFAESARMADKAAYTQLLTDYYIQALYAEFEAQYGMNKTQADQAMKDAYGMDVAGYAKVMAAAIDFDAMLTAAAHEGVYYVADGTLYSGADWNTLESGALRLTEDTLTLSIDDIGDILLTKVQ